MRLRRAQAALLSLALSGCSNELQAETAPPLDRFYFPTGVATSRLPAGSPFNTALLVASSNFDLRYSSTGGGTLLSVDADASAWNVAMKPLDAPGAERIGSYAGSVAVADAERCPGGSPVALVASRFDGTVYQFGIGTGGELTCGAGCVIGLDPGLRDPYDIGLACGPSGRHAYVGYLHPPKASSGNGYGAWITELDLDGVEPMRNIEIGDGPVRSTAYEAAQDRLWIAARSSGTRALLYSVVLSDPTWKELYARLAVDANDLYPLVRGLELRSLAVGTPIAGRSRRLYATGRIFDAEAIASDGSHPAGDVGGVLLVLDVADDVSGHPVVTLARSPIPLSTSVGDVAVIARTAATSPYGRLRDLVVATALDGDLLVVWDDEYETVAQVIGRDAGGTPLLGHRPMALAIDQRPTVAGSPAAAATVYVGSFGSHRVTRFVIQPATPWTRGPLESIGGLLP